MSILTIIGVAALIYFAIGLFAAVKVILHVQERIEEVVDRTEAGVFLIYTVIFVMAIATWPSLMFGRKSNGDENQ